MKTLRYLVLYVLHNAVVHPILAVAEVGVVLANRLHDATADLLTDPPEANR